uniref:Uncharacterized protein n=1 Tax=Acrobeloides nanus TaxID=290746 RepID=A0A914BZ01_9BILA
MFYPVDKIGNDSPRFLSPEQLAGNLLKNDLMTRTNNNHTIYNIDLTPKPKPKKVEKEKPEKSEEEIKDEEKNKRDEVRKEEIIEDIVDLLEKTMNPRRLLLALVEGLLAIYSFISGFVFLKPVKENQGEIFRLFIVLIIFGIFDFLAFVTFILSCCQTQMALRRLRRGVQIICGLCTFFFFILVVLVTFIVGIIGFYKAVYLYSSVKYTDDTNMYYISPFAYRSTLAVFTLHLVITVSKYCCCR